MYELPRELCIFKSLQRKMCVRCFKSWEHLFFELCILILFRGWKHVKYYLNIYYLAITSSLAIPFTVAELDTSPFHFWNIHGSFSKYWNKMCWTYYSILIRGKFVVYIKSQPFSSVSSEASWCGFDSFFVFFCFFVCLFVFFLIQTQKL